MIIDILGFIKACPVTTSIILCGVAFVIFALWSLRGDKK